MAKNRPVLNVTAVSTPYIIPSTIFKTSSLDRPGKVKVFPLHPMMAFETIEGGKKNKYSRENVSSVLRVVKPPKEMSLFPLRHKAMETMTLIRI